ncbi:glutamate ABC transporter substrate-binding protein [Sphaerisporangium melleum]|uniref:Glutamate ABC transporter substrate-binding protein n=1 Tax=Sphaerisporangium melleum TaxID=321316 RepID=A0A917VK69_9ACTN|nr:glutamate ABC transporter substrate-binding protein [Sphaerisporangium melleum]GGK89496.1 glutamate ABC transporter substrate-binding protein [Sphaerisporangium melleum]GII72506.1 glutamate ABC transporter substrate-binding protein [Sphaerisporangium melleum]
MVTLTRTPPGGSGHGRLRRSAGRAPGGRPLRRAAAALAAVAVLVPTAVSCAVGTSILDKETLVVGVKADQPALGVKASDGRYSGFDVDVATYIAGRLGKPVRFVTAPSAQREKMIKNGTVDLVVASYSITAERKTKVAFGGPYYVAHQDTLVRSGESGVSNVRDLRGRKLCQVTGSNSWKRVKEERKIPVDLVPAASYSECVEDLRSGKVDAVSTDDLILTGFATSGTKIVNAPFSDERYGIGIRTGDVDGCEAVNKAITEMYQDGTAKKLLQKWFARSGLALTFTVPQFEGCAEAASAEAE